MVKVMLVTANVGSVFENVSLYEDQFLDMYKSMRFLERF